MFIKKRLTISNILMLVIPVIVTVALAVAIRDPFFRIFEEKMNFIEENQPGAYEIQDMMRIDIKKMESKNFLDNLPYDFENRLEHKGYNLIIKYGKELIFSNLTENDNEAISEIGEDILYKSNSIVLERKDVSLVKNSIMYENKPLNIIAINSNYKPLRIDIREQMTTFMVGYIGIVVVFALIVITITNGILSSKIYKNLIKPLELLSYGADQIKNGNLDFDMNYECDDEFKQVCDDFDEMRKRLKESVQAKLKYEENRKELVAGISHDLRTPLTGIKGYVEGLIDGVANTPEKVNKYLNTIHRKACDMDELVDRLFLFSKLDTGKYPFDFELISVNGYFDKIYDDIREEFLKKGLKIHYINKCGEDYKIKIDCREIRRVILNILDNTVKYNDRENKESEFYISKEDGMLVIKISDNGKGVDDEILGKLFESFYRADPSRTNPSQGSGLGLAIAKNIVEAHRGKIEASNNNGLTIVIKLPM
ncbi:cell wall metabolism sensor histidine kinase WalK [uncultured Clostridium sp.]|uniref:sensor histidine kinase n=1 Tax=uncultured Clostridium sp. TaxID=59620 RepID=UPI0025DF1DD4|nr:HAMP domain-containing sensor histidine kinase [uncultured Clostridium sp.]